MQLTLNLPNPLAARQALFLSTNGQPFTTSRADMPDPSFTERNFALSTYLDSTGRSLPEYRLTHDGFALLAMGFTGREALAWKIAFLQAFNALEAELHARTARFATALDQVRPMLRPVVEATEAGYSRTDIAGPLGKSPASVTYHRRAARRLGLLAA